MLVVILREHSANKISVRTTQMTVTCFVHASSEQLRNHSVRMLSTSPLHSSPMTTSHRPQQRLYKQSHDGGIKLSCRSNSAMASRGVTAILATMLVVAALALPVSVVRGEKKGDTGMAKDCSGRCNMLPGIIRYLCWIIVCGGPPTGDQGHGPGRMH